MKPKIIAEKYGTITITVYKEPIHNGKLFYINADDEKLLPIVDIIDDTLQLY